MTLAIATTVTLLSAVAVGLPIAAIAAWLVLDDDQPHETNGDGSPRTMPGDTERPDAA